MDTLNYRKIPVPSPQSIQQAQLRQILQALSSNQDTIFLALSSAYSSQSITNSTTSTASSIPVKSGDSLTQTSTAVTITLPPDATASDVQSIAALANANKAAISTLVAAHNKVFSDIASAFLAIGAIKAQQAEIIKRLNKAN